MKQKIILGFAVCLAVITAGIAAIVISVQRGNVARARAEAAAAESDKAVAQAKKATKEAEAEVARKATAEANAQAEKAKVEERRLANEQAAAEAKAAEAKAAEAKARSAEAQAKAEEARALKTAAQAKESAAQAEAEKTKSLERQQKTKAQLESERLAAKKAEADKIIAEATALQLRTNDFATQARDLAEWQHDLEERERALQPEKTIADLAWAGGSEEDSVLDEKGNVHKQKKVPYSIEKDMTLPASTRYLARVERETSESEAEVRGKVKASVIASLEELYTTALKDGRVVDADFYYKTLKSIYPDWEFMKTTKEEKK